MLGVQADLQSLVVHRLQDGAQLLEPGSDVLAHSCHILHSQAGGVGRLVQRLPYGIGNLWQHCLKACAAVTAGMKDQAVRSQFPR